jgi:hypothetical protein
LGPGQHGLETATEQIPDVPAYDDNAQVDHTSPVFGAYFCRDKV